MRKVNAQGCLFPAHDVQTQGDEQRFGEATGQGTGDRDLEKPEDYGHQISCRHMGHGASSDASHHGPTAGDKELANMPSALPTVW